VREHVILLTGATGAVGRPLVTALARRLDVGRVHALTHVAPLGEPGVCAIPGDITAGRDLGLEAGAASSLASEVTCIVHAAADTGFAAPPETARRTNVEGTRNVLAFAASCRKLDRIVALSTTHVAGRRIGEILEEDAHHGAGFVNVYEMSKYEAEREIRHRSNRLPIAICRLSTVAGDSQSGRISRRGALHHAVLSLYASLAPMIPGREDSPVDLVALDYVADAIAFLATCGFEAGAVWHLCAGADTISVGELLDLTIDTILRHRPAWRRRAIARPALVDLETFELFRQSVEEAGDPALRASTELVSHFAPQLAFPKRFDDRRCRAALVPAALERPPIRDVWRSVVRELVRPV
jgi:long-chain acyl-CoA synthetase